MVKLVAFLKRREGMTPEEFYEHWEGTHGPLIRSTPELARHIVRYEQHRRVPEPSWAGTAGYDGVTIQWLESVDAFRAFCAEPAYAELILPDEEKFLDKEGLVWMLTEEPMVTMDGPTSGPRVGEVEA
jgi:uncharacterized protein (TIGR02118 family)